MKLFPLALVFDRDIAQGDRVTDKIKRRTRGFDDFLNVCEGRGSRIRADSEICDLTRAEGVVEEPPIYCAA
jgi:hypothetical protein